MAVVKPTFPVLQRTNLLSYGIVGCWPMTEGTGRVTADISGNGNNGVFNDSSLVWVERPLGNAISWGATPSGTTYLQCKSGRILSGLSFWSIAAIFTSGGGGNAIYCERAASGNDILKLDFKAPYIDAPYVTYRNDAGNLLQTSPSGNYADSLPHVAIATCNNGAISVYVDGVVNNTGNATIGTMTDSGVQCTIGGDVQDGGAYWNGDISGVTLYNYCLTLSQVIAITGDMFAVARQRIKTPLKGSSTTTPTTWGYDNSFPHRASNDGVVLVPY